MNTKLERTTVAVSSPVSFLGITYDRPGNPDKKEGLEDGLGDKRLLIILAAVLPALLVVVLAAAADAAAAAADGCIDPVAVASKSSSKKFFTKAVLLPERVEWSLLVGKPAPPPVLPPLSSVAVVVVPWALPMAVR